MERERIGAPRLVAIYAYLIGLTGIAAAAYVLVEDPHVPPSPPAVVVSSLLPPTVQQNGAVTVAGVPVTAPATHATPRLAALPTDEVAFDTDISETLTRIFLGSPPVVPPDRPNALAGLPAPAQSGALSLRPRMRPAEWNGIAPKEPSPSVTAAIGAVRPVARPFERETVEVAMTRPDTPIPAALPDAGAPLPDLPLVAQGESCPERFARSVPRRANRAADAPEVLARVRDIDGSKRDQVLEAEIRSGNIPDFLRSLVPVRVSGRVPGGASAEIVFCVMPDYLAIGDNRDFVRVPLGLGAATRIAADFDMVLPTARMVDQIYNAADLRLTPSPMPPGAVMTTTAYFQRHNATVEQQRRANGRATGVLVSGHKKDLVLTRRLAEKPGRVAIYGWHRRNGKPIQPLSTVHGAQYADYSHGVRLVSRQALLDGRRVDLVSLLEDPRYAALLTDEGPMGARLFAAR